MPRAKLNGKRKKIAVATGAQSAPAKGERLPKRERTRRQIVVSAMSVLSRRGAAQSSLPEIAQHAGVTVGTVYNHFRNRADVIAAVAVGVIDELEQRAMDSRRSLRLGAERVANGCHRYLAIARNDPRGAMLILELAISSPNLLKTIGAVVRDDIRLGVRQKDFKIFGETAAVDLVHGYVMLGMRNIALSSMPASYERAIVATVLQGLGLPAKRALELGRRRAKGESGRT